MAAKAACCKRKKLFCDSKHPVCKWIVMMTAVAREPKKIKEWPNIIIIRITIVGRHYLKGLAGRRALRI